MEKKEECSCEHQRKSQVNLLGPVRRVELSELN